MTIASGGIGALLVAGGLKSGSFMGNHDLEVLVVEDDEDDYFLLQDCLSQPSRWVFSLSWAPTFKAAVDHLNHHQPDLLLVDYDLGCNTGLDLVKALKAAERHIPSLLITGQNLDDLGGETEISSFFDGYLKKAGLTLENLEKALGVIF